nr:immunoglobulin heavy chain junction region [Macaca mulatta]
CARGGNSFLDYW